MDLQTTYLGLPLAHPIVASASPLSATLDGIRRLEDAGAAAVVTASVFEEELLLGEEALEAVLTVGAESHPEVTSYLPPLHGHGRPLAGYLEMIRRAAESASVPVIASLNATTHEGWVDIAADLQAARAAAIELNLFRIPTDANESSVDMERKLVGTVQEVRAAVELPIAVKLSPHLSAPAHFVRSFAEAGADGVVLFNRYFEPDINLETMTFRPALDLSTPEGLRLRLMWIALLAGRTPLSLAASGGVEGVEDVVKCLLAGADTVMTASALIRHGPRHLTRLVDALGDWLQSRGAASVAEIRGRMSADRLTRPEVLLAAQHTPELLLNSPCPDPAQKTSRH